MAISTPEDISSYVGWGQVDISGHVTSGGGVASLFGKPGLTVIMDAASGGDSPTVGGTIGPEAALIFDGTDWMVDYSYTPPSQPYTWGIMMEWTDVTGYQQFLGLNGAAVINIDGAVQVNAGSTGPTTTITTSVPYSLVAVVNGASSNLWLNGVKTTGNAGTASADRFTLGSPYGKPTVKISRFACYTKALDDTEAADLSDWLEAGQGGAPATYAPPPVRRKLPLTFR
jgi:hypothetical protein